MNRQHKTTVFFDKWIERLSANIQAKIWTYISRLLLGNTSNCQSVGDGIIEIKIDYQKGYRVYFTISKRVIIILLLGGDKKKQSKDIHKAKEIRDALKAREEI
jgi:putative addiction module killer protein